MDYFTSVGARSPDSLDILGQATLIIGFRDMAGNSVHCSMCCFLPRSFCRVMGLKRIWIVKQGLITDQLGEKQGGRRACVLPVLYQVYTNTCRIRFLAAFKWFSQEFWLEPLLQTLMP